MSYRSATTPGRLLTEDPLMECAGGCYSQPQVCGAVRLTCSPREWKWIVVARCRSDRTAIKLQETVIPNKRIFQGKRAQRGTWSRAVAARSLARSRTKTHTHTYSAHSQTVFFDGSPLSQQKPSFHREPLYTTCRAACPCNRQTCSGWHIQTRCEWEGSSGADRSRNLKE